MNNLYNRVLVRVALCVKYFELRKCVKNTLIYKHSPGESAKYVRSDGYLTCYERMKELVGSSQKRRLSGIILVRNGYEAFDNYKYTREGKCIKFGDNIRLGAYIPNKAFSWIVKSYTIVMGAFVTPWFTDYIDPLAFGLFSTGCLVEVVRHEFFHHYAASACPIMCWYNRLI